MSKAIFSSFVMPLETHLTQSGAIDLFYACGKQLKVRA